MKKVILLLTCMLVLAIGAQAQKDGGKGSFQWGLKLGPNFSTLVGEDAEPTGDENKKMKLGLHGGFFAMIYLSNMWYFQPELLYSGQGVKYEDGEDKVTISTNHLNVPLCIRWQSAGGFYLLFGPQVGFTLNGKAKYEFQGQEDEEDLEDLKSFILSGLVGLGYKAPSGWGAYLRYGRSFSAAFDSEGSEDVKIYNSTISLSLFYLFAATKSKAKSGPAQ